MNLLNRVRLGLTLCVLLAPVTLVRLVAADELTGPWAGDDGGIYYVRQAGNAVWWVGLSDKGQGFAFTNVFRGTLNGNTIDGDWVDVPRGQTLQGGTLILDVVSAAPKQIELRKQRQSGGFAGSIWRRTVLAGQAYTGGTRQHKIGSDGTIIDPDGKRVVPIETPPPTPPALPNDNRVIDWLKYHNKYLLDIIRSLVDQTSVDNYLRSEDPSAFVYQQINNRTKTIAGLTR